MSDFIAATSLPMKWSVGENRFAKEGDENTKSLSLFIPQACVSEFAAYLNRLSGEMDRLKPGKVWNHDTQEEIEVQGFYINAKGRNGQYGDFGNINLQQIPAKTAVASGDIPF